MTSRRVGDPSLRRFDQSQASRHRIEGRERLVDVGGGVRGGRLGAQARLAARHNREAHRAHVDAGLHQRAAQRRRLLLVADHDRRDRAGAAEQAKAQPREPFAQAARVVGEAAHQRVVARGDVDRRERAGRGRGADGCGEHEEAAAVVQRADARRRAGDVAAGEGAERLREGPSVEVDFALAAAQRRGPAAARPDHAGGMALVDDEGGAAAAAGRDEARQVGGVALHAEDAVGDHQLPGGARFGQQRIEMREIGVIVDAVLGRAEPAAVDDAGVVEPVGEDAVALADQRAGDRDVGRRAGIEEQRRFGAVEARERRAQRLVDRRGGERRVERRARAVALERLLGARDHLGVVGQAEVVVGAEDDPLAPVDDSARADRPAEHGLQRAAGRGGGVVHDVEAVIPSSGPQAGAKEPCLHGRSFGCGSKVLRAAEPRSG
jgi:hypothetical protein